ncbi:aminopeptidase P N-terminal domain-containing protein [Paucibacter sp. APW11]|uniref:Xaa-Pro aminopeptidase n=1 Tax=Roseateles aquae TaxID=3077235 RepID=A0ABU3PGL7_9BURK|nr:aminopeptidase P N-terminal domain-containing protein [Paucibacter sp. APW11]MDT9001740.1 aminopeptidase P N-terminal domain-containing protein [Paucibacter sp. APW11]
MNLLQACAARRDRVFAAIGDAALLLPNHHLPQREDDASRYHGWRYGFEHWRPASDFYYLCGFEEAESLLLLIGGSKPRSILFCRARDPAQEQWNGRRLGPAAAADMLGLDEAYPITELEQRLPQLLQGQRSLHYPFGVDAGHDQRIFAALNTLRGARAIRQGSVYPIALHDPRALLHEMRVIKDEAEVALIRQAADISGAAMVRAMRFARPGQFEYEVEAELLHEFRRRGARGPAYNPIVAGGANACILHYIENKMRLNEGELLLIDAGCDFQGYSADITRTLPIGRRFSGLQRELYEIVLDALDKGIATLQPGQSLQRLHQTHLQVVSQGLLDLGLLQGSLDGVLERQAYLRFLMCGTGHYLGLDTHDAGRYHRPDGSWRPAQSGMVLTAEPGIYISPADDIPERYWNIGVRIEDDVLVTAAGPELLTGQVPRCIGDIEALRD